MITCDRGTGKEASAPPPPLRARAALTGAFSRSYLTFDGDDLTFDRGAAVASADLFFGRFDLTLGAGSLFAGTLEGDSASYDLDFGWVASAGLSWRVLDDRGALPYVVLALSAGGASAGTERTRGEGPARGSYLGLDVRFGATVGKTFFGWFSPYASVRVFGGPIFWTLGDETKLGTDRFHFQGALGAVFLLPGHVDLFVEGQPGAEMGALGGFGVSF